MKFTPNYCVSYRGVFHNAGCAFEIDPQDAGEMSGHGTITQEESNERKPGRPKKAADQ